ncbi:MAG: hypothetical protein OEZ43_04215 [Gammaproteobacteria bacterium]|nr:hypothetical protein [Gammaproteobacteria bacterium]
MNIIIDMVTGEIDGDQDIIVISNRYTPDQPEKLENREHYVTELRIQPVEIVRERPPGIPADIANRDIDTFLNDMN